MSEKTITGSCNCGRHKYTIPQQTDMNLCHCSDCRKWAGSMYSAHIMTPTKDVNTHNSPEPRKHTMKGDKGKDMERAWCDECGCGIWIRPGGDTEKMFLKAGLFKPHEIPNPTSEVYLKNIESWETLAKGTRTTSDVLPDKL